MFLYGDGITYTPPSGYTGTDTFTYTVTDAVLLSAEGTVTVKIAVTEGRGQNILGITADTATVTVRLAGVPGVAYQIEASTDLLNWVKLGQGTASAASFFHLTDAEKNIYPCRYYRAGL